MAFSGYPDGRSALSSIWCAFLRPGGRLVLDPRRSPSDAIGPAAPWSHRWKCSGDLIRDMAALFGALGLDAVDREIGGFGSVHLYIATKPG